MTIDEPREGRQLPGAKTSEEELAGIEQVLVVLLDGAIELENAAAPVGDVRVSVMNRGSLAFGFTVSRGTDGSANRGNEAIARWARLEPGQAEDTLVELEEGEYALTSTEADGGEVVAAATLVVQPQQGLPGSRELER